MIQFALLALSALFVIVDPIGAVPTFIGLTPSDTPAQRLQMARRACLVAWGILVLFAVSGAALFDAFGITLAAFKVAGGLLLMLTAIDQLRANPTRTRSTAEEVDEGAAKADVSIVPLAMPLLAGPGSIATVMMLVAQGKTLGNRLIVIGAITLILVLAYVALALSDRIAKVLGTTGRLIATRLMGLVLAAIAAQFMLDGVRESMNQ